MKALLQTVVVAVSGSEASINAAKYGIALAKQYRSRLIAVYVVDTATVRELLHSKIFVEDESRDYEQNMEQNGNRYLNYVEDLARKKGVAAEKLLKHGAISTAVVETAMENGAGVILLGGFDEGGRSRDVLSRQHREILRNARCSILIVKEPEMDFIYRKL